MISFIRILWQLLCAHAVCDYALQHESMIALKSPNFMPHNGRENIGPWWWTMAAHSFINGAGVDLATGIWQIGILEVVIHFVLDTAKCKGWISTYADQYGHVASKLVWAALAVSKAG